MARIENAFQKGPTMSLRVANTETCIRFRTIQSALREKLNMFTYNMYFQQQLVMEAYPWCLDHAQTILRDLCNASVYLEKVFSLMNAFFIPMDLQKSVMKENWA